MKGCDENETNFSFQYYVYSFIQCCCLCRNDCRWCAVFDVFRNHSELRNNGNTEWKTDYSSVGVVSGINLGRFLDEIRHRSSESKRIDFCQQWCDVSFRGFWHDQWRCFYGNASDEDMSVKVAGCKMIEGLELFP